MKSRLMHASVSNRTNISRDHQCSGIRDPRLGSHLEKEALSDVISFDNNNGTPAKLCETRQLGMASASAPIESSCPSLTTLATLLILCKAYISSNNHRCLLVLMEQAFILAKKHWVEYSSNPEFIFLIRCLGYMHTTAMLSPGEYKLDAPDFLTLSNDNSIMMRSNVISDTALPSQSLQARSNADQTEADVRSQLLEFSAITKLHEEFQSSCFGDINPTTGISHLVAALLYRIGRLKRLRAAARGAGDKSHWFWGAFESDLDGLDIQLQQLLQYRDEQSKIFERSVHRLNLLDAGYEVKDLRQSIDLTRYNDSLVHCGRILFLEQIACGSNPVVKDVSASVQEVLRLCASIPDSSHTAKLLALPLFIAGERTSTTEMQSFVRSRFRYLSDHSDIVANTQALLERLETKWNNSFGSGLYSHNTSPDDEG